MEHNEAERTQAADRYLRGELTASEREAFEEHFFTCPACAEDVRAEMLLRANAKAVFGEEEQRRPKFRSNWLAWLGSRPGLAASWAALCAVLAFTGYQNLAVLPELRRGLERAETPQSYRSFALRSVSRGEDLILNVPAAQHFIGLALHLDPQHRFGNYRAEFARKAGPAVFSVTCPAPAAPGLPLEFLVPASSLEPGEYTMKLYGVGAEGQETDIGSYSFVVKHL